MDINGNTKLYLAYGSNVNLPHMNKLCPSARYVGLAEIPDYQLMYRSGYLTILPRKENRVICALWQISPLDEKKLDFYEDYPNLYWKQKIETKTSADEQVTAMVYIMCNEYLNNYKKPTSSYESKVRHGYEKIGIPDEQARRAFAELRSHWL